MQSSETRGDYSLWLQKAHKQEHFLNLSHNYDQQDLKRRLPLLFPQELKNTFLVCLVCNNNNNSSALLFLASLTVVTCWPSVCIFHFILILFIFCQISYLVNKQSALAVAATSGHFYWVPVIFIEIRSVKSAHEWGGVKWVPDSLTNFTQICDLLSRQMTNLIICPLL